MHRVLNFDELAENDLRKDALMIAEAGYGAIDIMGALERGIHIENDGLRVNAKTYEISGRKVFFVGVGKCAFTASEAIEKIFGDKLTGGIALGISNAEKYLVTKIEMLTGTHPLPSEANVHATKRIIEFLSCREKDDLVIMFISGGGSTLLCSPEDPMTYADESELFKMLTARGASIQDINIVRKHISRARGGALAVAAYPAEVVSLIISDVPGNDMEYVASGPTSRDFSTIDDAMAILVKYGASDLKNIKFIETQKDGKYFERVTNVLFLSNQNALSAMKDEASRLGYVATIANDQFTGEARDIGRVVVEKLHNAPSKTAFIYAGESTVTLGANAGNGGRNQEMALAALADIREDELVLPFASDGHDNTDHAGAIADETTRAHAREKNLSVEEYARSHDSYDFFKSSGDALVTGYTGSNVSDLVIALKK